MLPGGGEFIPVHPEPMPEDVELVEHFLTAAVNVLGFGDEVEIVVGVDVPGDQTSLRTRQAVVRT